MLKLSTNTIRIGIYGASDVPAGRGIGLWPSGYKGSVTAAGGEPIFLDDCDENASWSKVLSGLHGVVLAGCADLNPFALEGMCHWARDHRLPLLAIDHGLLVLNSAFGGANFYDLPREFPEALQHRHRPEPGLRHAILVEADTILAGLYGEGDIVVNSEHTQAVQRPAQGFTVGARALDGVIEEIEWTKPRWFCMGVQWQPASASASGLDIQVFRGLVDAARNLSTKPARRRMAVGA
jgi:putative glutamine amidotransferase